MEKLTFYGEYEHTIDAKGRMFIPAKFREELGDDFVIFKGLFDKCLYVMSDADFKGLSAKLNSMPMANANAVKVRRKLYSSAFKPEFDAQKRVLIPAKMREYAGLEKEVAVVGVGTHIELWNLDDWRKLDEETDQADVIAGAFDSLGDKGYTL